MKIVGTGKYALRDILNEEFDRRRRTNPRYSLRAFARDLGVQASNLSNFFKTLNSISLEKAIAMMDTLPIDRDDFVRVAEEWSHGQERQFRDFDPELLSPVSEKIRAILAHCPRPLSREELLEVGEFEENSFDSALQLLKLAGIVLQDKEGRFYREIKSYSFRRPRAPYQEILASVENSIDDFVNVLGKYKENVREQKIESGHMAHCRAQLHLTREQIDEFHGKLMNLISEYDSLGKENNQNPEAKSYYFTSAHVHYMDFADLFETKSGGDRVQL